MAQPRTVHEETQTTLSIPSLLLTAALLALLVRYLFFSSTASSSAQRAQRTAPGRRIPPDAIETVCAMFPQLARRDVEWDLRRNGVSVQATTERVLRSGSLDPAPPSFRAQDPPPATRPNPATQGHAASASKHPDLITRYNLSARINDATAAAAATSGADKEKGAWSASKNERAEALKRRREEMVLEARRRMMERDKGKAPA